MKKLSLLIAFSIFMSISISCKNDNTKETSNSIENKKEEHKVPPHGDKKDHPKGKRKGGSPVQSKTLEEIGGYKIGETATDFYLKNIDENMVSLAGIANAKGYIVTFTCNECPFSKLYEDRLIALNNKYASQGYPVVAINSNSPENNKEGYEAMQNRAKEKGFTFPYLVDEGQKIYPKYGAVRTPHVFLLDENLTVQYIGAIDDNAKSPDNVSIKYVENAINALELGQKPTPNLTKAIGCPIKANRS